MQYYRLYGGHRNLVYKTNSFVKVVWKDGFRRKKQIREGVLLENFVAAHTDIKARLLVDKSKPIQEEDGKLVTYFHYAAGEIRYPWNLSEIASSAKLLGRLHSAINASTHQRIKHLLHLDFARGNILFQPGTSEAVGIIDFETAAKGPVEQELGRSLSFILVDTLTESFSGMDARVPLLKFRMKAFLENYPYPFRSALVLRWAKEYLNNEDYGDRNTTRDWALRLFRQRGI